MTLTLPALGILLPVSVLHIGWFAVLAAFVAINTVMYSALALAKILPKLYPSDWVKPINRRAQTRSIYPEGMPAPRRTSRPSRTDKVAAFRGVHCPSSPVFSASPSW